MAAGADHDLTRGLARTILDASPAAILAIDPDGLICYTNPLVAPPFGYAEGELKDSRSRSWCLRRSAKRTAPAGPRSRPTPHRGRWGPCPTSPPCARTARCSPSPSASRRCRPTAAQVLAAVNDMTARLRDEQRIRELGRAYLTLAQTNQAVVRAADVGSLYQEACDISVMQGGYLGAWVGVTDDDGWVRVVATAGSLDEYIYGLRITTDPGTRPGRAPRESRCGRAVRATQGTSSATLGRFRGTTSVSGSASERRQRCPCAARAGTWRA